MARLVLNATNLRGGPANHGKSASYKFAATLNTEETESGIAYLKVAFHGRHHLATE